MSKTIRQQVKKMCAGLDIPLVGFAPAGRWDEPLFEPWVPEAFRPRAIFPETNTVIVIGLPVSLPVLEYSPFSSGTTNSTGRSTPCWTRPVTGSLLLLRLTVIHRSGFPGTVTAPSAC